MTDFLLECPSAYSHDALSFSCLEVSFTQRDPFFVFSRPPTPRSTAKITKSGRPLYLLANCLHYCWVFGGILECLSECTALSFLPYTPRLIAGSDAVFNKPHAICLDNFTYPPPPCVECREGIPGTLFPPPFVSFDGPVQSGVSCP